MPKDSKPTVTPMAAITVTPANVISSSGATMFDAIAYETIAQGQPVAYLDPQPINQALPSVRLADATTQYKVIGLAVTGASPGQPVKVVTKDPSFLLGGNVAGDVVYLGVTAGALTVTYADLTVGKYVSVLGVGTGGGKINMDVIRSDNPK